jgi:hypothetical protein
MMHPARTTRPKRCVGVKSESVTKGRGNVGIRCPPRKADWKFGETVCSNKLVDQRSSRRGAPRCWSKAPRAFLTNFCRNPGSRSKLAIPRRSSFVELSGLFRRQLGAQWPMMRTEGSFTKAPAVVPRPVASISQRSMTRTGDTVVVPTRRTLMRCGMSEPVTKTVCSITFSFRSELALTGVSASEALAAIRTVTPAAITLFTTQNTPAGPRCKSPDRNTRRSSPSQDSEAFAGIELELLRQARVPKPVRSIVGEAGIILTVSLFAGCRRRIPIK